MKADIKEKWIVALESGKYEQAKGALRRGNAFCCLGVLCEVFKEETGEGEWRHLGEGDYSFVARDQRQLSHLPLAVRDWAGLESPNPRIGEGDGGFAAWLNDNKYDFAGIAELIRKLPATT